MGTLASASFARFAQVFARRRLSILIYHRVLEQPDPLLPGEPDARSFAERMAWIAAAFNVLPLDEAVDRLLAGKLPAAPLAITFDDGYADNFRVALPILQRYGLPATVFVASGFIDGGRMWNDTVIESVRRAQGDSLELQHLGLGALPIRDVNERRTAIDRLLDTLKHKHPIERQHAADAIASRVGEALPDDLMLDSAMLRALSAAGIAIGGHTVTHPILATLDIEAAWREIDDGRRALESVVGSKVTLFAYPNGRPGSDFGPEHQEIVRSVGFRAAVTTSRGVAARSTDRFLMPRFTPWDRSNFRFGLRLAQNAMGMV